MLPPPLSLPSSASKAALRRALGSRAPSVAMLDDGMKVRLVHFSSSGGLPSQFKD